MTSKIETSTRENLKLIISCAVFGVAGATCISNNVLSLVAIKLGADDIFLGILSFLFTAPLVFGIFSMNAIELHGKLKILKIWTAISLAFTLFFLLIPYLAKNYNPKLALYCLLIVQLLVAGTGAIGNTAWFPILKESIPVRIIGRFFAALRISWQTAALITYLFIAYFLGRDSEWWKFNWIFFSGFVFLLIRFILLFFLKEKKKVIKSNEILPIKTRFKEVLENSKFRNCIIYLTCYSFLAMAAEPFKIKMLKELGFSSGYIIAATSMFGLGAIISLGFWGKLADTFGNRAIFSISHIGMIITSILWILVDNATFGKILVIILYLSFGIFHNGNGIAQTRYVIHSVPDTKLNYINVINFITFFAIAIAPLFAGCFLKFTAEVRFKSGAIDMNNYQILYVIIGMLFLIPHLLRRKLRVENEKSTSNVVAFVLRPLRNVFVGSFKKLK